MSHSETDAISLELARQVAGRLRARPELLAVAQENLQRWARVNIHTPSLLRCYEEWQKILTRPLEEICGLLCLETDDAQRLRQNSPFVGILSPAEVWAIKASHRHAPATA